MTEPNSKTAEPATDHEGDRSPYTFQYGHGRMPFFMKIVWLAFLIFSTWYVASFLLTAVGEELGALGS